MPPRRADLDLDRADALYHGALDVPARTRGRPSRDAPERVSLAVDVAHRHDWEGRPAEETLAILDAALVFEQHERARRDGLGYRAARPVRHLAPPSGPHLDAPRSRTLAYYRDDGRRLLAALGAGPWALYVDGRLGRGWWSQRPEVLAALERWAASWRPPDATWTVREVLAVPAHERAALLRGALSA